MFDTIQDFTPSPASFQDSEEKVAVIIALSKL
jgi:hypothetical protein